MLFCCFRQMSAKLSQVPGLMGSEAPSGAFPATFSDFFCRLHAEPDEGEDLVVALLEDKLLPRPTGPSRHGHMSTTTAEQLLRQQVAYPTTQAHKQLHNNESRSSLNLNISKTL